ncbi:hypothetical protein [Streptomyces sp. NBC_00576]|uniref:hypothetical protein n=1 Tax=Streptomyces sp. NBC_00576 TaxID=2903665 RepID=UPI003FCD1A7E
MSPDAPEQGTQAGQDRQCDQHDTDRQTQGCSIPSYPMCACRAVVGVGNFVALGELLAEDVVLRSPVAFKPYEGRPIVAAILRGVGRVFTDFHCVR